MPTKVFETRQEREAFLRSLVSKGVVVFRENHDNYVFAVADPLHSDSLIAMDVTIRRIARWPSNVKLGGPKQRLN